MSTIATHGQQCYYSAAAQHRVLIGITFLKRLFEFIIVGNALAVRYFRVFFFFSFFPACAARFMIIPLWHRGPGTAPLTPAIWLSHTTLGYTVAHSAIDWGDEGQLFNTSEQQVLLSSWLFSYLISVPPKKVSCLVAPARRFKPEAICRHSPRTPLTQPWQTGEVATQVRWAMLHCVKW